MSNLRAQINILASNVEPKKKHKVIEHERYADELPIKDILENSVMHTSHLREACTYEVSIPRS